MEHSPQPPKVSIISLIITVGIIAAIIIFLATMLTSCEKHCLPADYYSPANIKARENYNMLVNKANYDAIDRILLVASSKAPSDTDMNGYIKSYSFQKFVLADKGMYVESSYKTTDYFYTDSISGTAEVVFYSRLGYGLIDRTSGKKINDSTAEYNAYPEAWDIYGVGRYSGQKKISPYYPKVRVYNPERTDSLAKLADAYNWYVFKNYEDMRHYTAHFYY